MESNADIDSLVAGLNQIQPGEYPAPLFYAMARLMVLATVEIVPVRMGASGVEVYLTKREASDPYWPNLWHNPGSIVRAYDAPGSFTDAVNRVCRGELGLGAWDRPTFVGPWFWQGARGSVVSLVHWLDVSQVTNLAPGQFFSIDALPVDGIPGMESILRMAAEHYAQVKVLGS